MSTCSLADFHIALQIILGWSNSHLHLFEKDSVYYGEIDNELLSNVLDEREYRLEQLFKVRNDSLNYIYDFGDEWEHKIVLEKILPFETKIALPRCIRGVGACPPEDVGGICGYELFLDAISDTLHPEHKEMLDRVGGNFMMDYFDVKATNTLLQKFCHGSTSKE